jgi:chromosomal replication initiation ATPase DnaA
MERCEHCGSIITDSSIVDLLKKISVLVEKDNLDSPSRKQNLKHKRCYLYRKMRDKGIPLQRIGEYFNRDHATIIHGLGMEECFRNDKQYLKDTKEYDNLFQIHQ